jgi:hypothetical protein
MRRVSEADFLAVWSLPDALKLIMKICNDGIKMGDDKKLKSETLKFTNFQTLWYYNP